MRLVSDDADSLARPSHSLAAEAVFLAEASGSTWPRAAKHHLQIREIFCQKPSPSGRRAAKRSNRRTAPRRRHKDAPPVLGKTGCAEPGAWWLPASVGWDLHRNVLVYGFCEGAREHPPSNYVASAGDIPRFPWTSLGKLRARVEERSCRPRPANRLLLPCAPKRSRHGDA